MDLGFSISIIEVGKASLCSYSPFIVFDRWYQH